MPLRHSSNQIKSNINLMLNYSLHVIIKKLLEENIRKVKLSTPDYKDMDPEHAVQDFHARRANYNKVYEPVSERDGPFVKIINSKQFIVNAIRGYLPLKVSVTRNTFHDSTVANSLHTINCIAGRSFCDEFAHPPSHLLFDTSRTIRIQFVG